MPGSFEPPSKALDLTPPGFTAMLREAGALPRGAVTSLEVTQRLQTPVSHLCFATVTYSREAPQLPTCVLVKWPAEGSAAPDRGLPEVTFYKELAPSLSSPPIARCVAAAPMSTGRQWLVLEDLRATHTNPPWPDPPSRSEAEGAVSALARIHAHWWEAPTLGSSVGAPHTHASLREMVQDIAGQLPNFLEALGDTLSPPDRRLLETVFGSSLAPWLRLADSRALTVTHGDAHTWNFLFPRSGAGLPYLIDWQLWHVDVGARDLAFMIALHWDPALRQDLERPLLHLYHRRLADGGVTGYSFEDLWLDYRRCVVRNLTFPIILWRRGLPWEAWRRRLDCALAAYRDLDGNDVL
jgi:aminoglycoside phosphotransferase (APT) family kinase protein